MLALTLFKIFINNLKVGCDSAIKCYCFQPLKGEPERLEKTEQNKKITQIAKELQAGL